MAIFDKKKLENLEDDLVIEDTDGFYNSNERTDDSIDQEESMNMDFLNKIKEDAKAKLAQKENQATESKKKGLFGFGGKSKKKSKGTVNISGIKDDLDSNSDIIIIGANNKTIKRATKATFKTILTLATIGVLSIVVFLGLSYKFVPANVEGANYDIGSYSIVANLNTPNLNNLKSGDKVIVNKNHWSPIVLDFKLYTIKSRDGGLMHAMNEEGYTETLEATEVSYILKK